MVQGDLGPAIEQHFRRGATALDGVYLAEYAQLLCKWGLAALLGAHPNSEMAVLLKQLEAAVFDTSL